MPREIDRKPDDLTVLYREGAAEQPPEELNTAILAAARESLTPWHRRPALAAISTAAVVAIAVGLTMINPELDEPVSQVFDRQTELAPTVTTTPQAEAQAVKDNWLNNPSNGDRAVIIYRVPVQ